MARRGIKPLVMAKIKAALPQLREGKPIFLRITDGSLSQGTLRSYIYECMTDLRFGDATLPNVSTKEVIFEGNRAIEIQPRVGTAVSLHNLRSAVVPFDPAMAEAAKDAIEGVVPAAPAANHRAAWITACLASAIDLVAVIDKAGGRVPDFAPDSAEGKALIEELRQ